MIAREKVEWLVGLAQAAHEEEKAAGRGEYPFRIITKGDVRGAAWKTWEAAVRALGKGELRDLEAIAMYAHDSSRSVESWKSYGEWLREDSRRVEHVIVKPRSVALISKLGGWWGCP